jgi:hypothetical protein
LQYAGSEVIRKVLTLAAALLAAFHAWLFAGQLWAGELLDLALVSRWVIAAGLIGTLFQLRRRGMSLVRGRQPVAVWLLAALLHGPALARDLDVVAPSMPEVVATITQAVTLVSVAGSLLLLLLALRRGRSGVVPLRALSTLHASPFAGALPPYRFLRFSPRPPPTNN